MRSIYLLAVVFIFSFSNSFAQEDRSIKITGVVLDAESLEPIPYTSILIREGNTGTVADNNGYFSFLAQPKDTITFRSVGYQNRIFILPNIEAGKTYSLIELMVRENLLLEEVQVYALPESSDFAKTILKKDLSPYQKEQMIAFKKDLDAILEEQKKEHPDYYQQYRYAKLYDLTGVVPPNNFLNPMTYANFIRDWKKYSKQK